MKRGRGKRINGSDKVLFNGEYWLAEQAMHYGLIDGIGDLRGTLQKRFGKNVLTPLIALPSGFFARRLPRHVRRTPPDGWAKTALGTLEERAMWGRYGL